MLLEPTQPIARKRINLKLLAFSLVLISLTLLVLQSSKSNKLHSKDETTSHEFLLYQQKFGKSYLSSDHMSRFQKFQKNQAFIHDYNSAQSTVTLAINKFADMDFTEFQSKYLMNLPYSSRKPSFISAPVLDPLLLEPVVNWTSQGVVTPVKDQGHCGSCWAFSTTGTIESAWAIKHGELISLSEQQLVSCTLDYECFGCNGGWPSEAILYTIKNGGLNNESNYEYTASDSACNETLQKKSSIVVTGIEYVQDFNHVALMNAVSKGPVSVLVQANILWMLYSQGTITNNCGYEINHAVLAVGYNSHLA